MNRINIGFRCNYPFILEDTYWKIQHFCSIKEKKFITKKIVMPYLPTLGFMIKIQINKQVKRKQNIIECHLRCILRKCHINNKFNIHNEYFKKEI